MSILDYIRKVNGIDKNKNLKQNEIDDMVDDYEHGKNMLITRFSVMINTSDALDVYINDSNTPIKGIVDEKRKYSSTNNAEETIQVYPQLINSGDYVSFKKFYESELSKYLIVSEIKSNRDNYEGIILKCNQKLKWKDKNGVHEYACYCKNDSYGVKDAYSGSKLVISETKLKIYIQFNNETKNIKENMRFIFNNREQDIYKVITASTVINKNLLILTCENDNYRPQDDDLENNLAYNKLEKEQEEKPTEPEPIQSYEIMGRDSVIHKNNYTYTLNPVNQNCTWYLDENDEDCTAQLINQTYESVVVYAMETLSEDWFTLYAKDGDTILAKKKVIIKSK